ncbi:MAG: 50S ribosomal protein L4 [Armatimonadetes bacterium]|nr:50S ribosomal protein L4 [Armatimonadota bacterium]
MPQLAVRNLEGDKVGQIEVSDSVLGVPLNVDLIHQALCVVESQRHVGRHRTLSRGEIDLSKAKWYRQKGLGRARHGSRSANLFVGGYKAHGPTGEKRILRLPKRMRRKALLSALSEQVRDGVVTVVDSFDLPEISTRAVARALDNLGCQSRTLLLLSPEEFRDQTLYLSCRNIPFLLRREVPHISVRDVLWAEHILITKRALDALAEFAQEGGE